MARDDTETAVFTSAEVSFCQEISDVSAH